MITQYLDLIASPEIMNQIHKEAQRQKLRTSEPSNLESAADVLDAPLSPDDVIKIFEFIKVYFETNTAVIGFLTAVIGLLKVGSIQGEIIVKDAKTNKTLGKINKDTSPKNIKQMLDIDD